MHIAGTHYRTVWWENNQLQLIEQNVLPFKFSIISLSNYRETCHAICNMQVRGAGAIGATAGFAMAQAVLEHDSDAHIQQARHVIQHTRPTAQNLFYAVERVYQATISATANDRKQAALDAAQAIADEDAHACQQIGIHGNTLIRDGMNILTHCNAGWLAFVDYGSALSPIYQAQHEQKSIHVWVDETRPRGQGARLTAWELGQEHVPHTIIPDNAAAYYAARGDIDMMIVGADRIAANGDTANKIGTLEKAIIAKAFDIPFYIAAPSSTIDHDCATGNDIPIEMRSEDEVLFQHGISHDGSEHCIRVCAPGSHAQNPAFDVTPASYITGIITENGIICPNSHAIAPFRHV